MMEDRHESTRIRSFSVTMTNPMLNLFIGYVSAVGLLKRAASGKRGESTRCTANTATDHSGK